MAVKSAAWTAARIGGRQFANLVLFFGLTIKLNPSDLGIASLAAALPMLLLPIASSGVREVVIQRRELDDESRDTAFLIVVTIGVLLALTIAVLSQTLSDLFNDPRIQVLSLVGSAIPLVASLGSIHEALWERDFRYKNIAVIHLLSSLIAGFIVIAAIYFNHAIWAFILFNLTYFFMASLQFWLLSEWHPENRWSLSEVLRQLRFAGPIVLTKTFTIGNLHIVEMIIGAVLSPGAAAFFRFGANFIRMLNQFTLTPIVQILLPAFVKSEASPEKTVSRTITVLSAILFPAFLGMATILPSVINGLHLTEWSAGAYVGSILAFGVFATIVGPAGDPMLIAKGRGGLTTINSGIALLLSMAFVYIGAGYGVECAAWGHVLRSVVIIPLTLYMLHRALGIRPMLLLRSMLPFAVISLVLFTVLLPVSLSLWGGEEGDYIRPFAMVIMSAVLYVLAIRFLMIRFAVEQYQTIVRVVPVRLRFLF